MTSDPQNDDGPGEAAAEDPIQKAVDRLAEPAVGGLLPLLQTYLSAELLTDSVVRMEQAGDRSGQRTLLSDVFVDLQAGPPQRPGEPRVRVGRSQPITREMQVTRRWRWSFDVEAEDEGDDIEHLPEALLSRLANAPAVPFGGRVAPATDGVPNALLVTGGPGWGKSTLGQMLCQVHRAELLAMGRAPTLDLPKAVRDVQAATLLTAGAYSIQPVPPRFPVRIVLSTFADWLAETKPDAGEAVLRYVAHRISKRMTRERLNPQTLARDLGGLLNTLPSLFVFDGLDEVAETAGRPEVLAAVEMFLKWLEAQAAPAFVMMTSRPAAVPRESSVFKNGFVEWQIRRLSQVRARRQAFLLVGVRHKNDQDRQEEVAARLGEAWTSDTARPLFEVPLHVALTVILVDAIGRLPEERWRLFDEHYRVLYQRELEKPTSAASILREHRPLIDAVHQRVALLLQVEGERAGGSHSMLRRDRLKDIIDTILEDDVEEPERSALVTRVMEAATDRLVMLTRMEEGPDQTDHYGFELRSLQEHFAAEAMFAGREAHVTERLRRIAFAPAFRNVLLIAASKIDAKSELWHLRASIADLCAPAEETAGEDPARVLRRAELALDLLEDGFPHRSKKLADRVVDAALTLLTLPPHSQLLRMTWTMSSRAPEALRARLEQMAPVAAPESMSFWLVVVELAESGVAWAAALGDAHWPAADKVRRAIVKTAVRHWERLGSWLGRKIGASPSSFPPAFLHSVLGGMVHVEIENDDLPDWLNICLSHIVHDRWGVTALVQAVELQLGEGPALHLHLVQCSKIPAELNNATEEDGPKSGADMHAAQASETAEESVPHGEPGIPEAWLPFVVAVAFVSNPSPGILAGALNRLAAVHDEEAIRWAERWMPWVLRMCVRRAKGRDELRRMADTLRDNPHFFGAPEDWAAAERAWSKGITLDQIGPVEWPAPTWDGSWFAADAAEPAHDRWSGISPRQIEAIVTGSFTKDRWGSSPLAARLALAALVELAYHGEPTPVSIEPDELEALVARSGITSFPIATVVPLQLWQRGGAAWPAALDRIAKSLPVAPLPAGYHASLGEYVAKHWAAEPTRTGLLHWLAELGSNGWVPPAGLSAFLPELSTPESRLDGWGLRLSDGFSVEEAPALAESFASRVMRLEPVTFAQIGVQRGMRQRCSPEARRAFARTLFERLPSDLVGHWWKTFALQLLEAEQPNHSGLDDRSAWTELALPLPLPRRPPSSPPPRAAASRIEGVCIRNVRGLHDLVLPLPANGEGSAEGRWIVLLGENGVGKSTVLRAVALALIDPALAATFVKASPAGYLTHDRDKATIEVTIPGRTLTANIERDGLGSEVLSTEDAVRPLVFGYGCRRSSALGGKARALSFNPADRIATLFDEGADLVHAETWLKNRAFAADKNKREEVLLDEVKKALLRAMPGIQAIDVRPDGVWLYGPAVGKTSLAGLSDGYLTMMGWIVDLIARWTDLEERKKQVIEPNFMQEMEGVVLLDELDLHLHPRWQIQVIDRLREMFPRMTFLVTTHNPLTLLGAREGEVIVLRRAETGGNGETGAPSTILAEQRDLRPGLTIDQILTGAWFGLSSTLDEDTLRLIEKHQLLLRERRSEDDSERLAVEKELRARLGRFADTSIERMAQQVAAELSPRSIRDLSTEEREALRTKMLDAVARRRAAAAKKAEEQR